MSGARDGGNSHNSQNSKRKTYKIIIKGTTPKTWSRSPRTFRGGAMVLTLPSLLDQFARCWTRRRPASRSEIGEMILWVMVRERVVIVSKETQVPYVARRKFWEGFLGVYWNGGGKEKEGEEDVEGLFAKVGLRGF